MKTFVKLFLLLAGLLVSLTGFITYQQIFSPLPFPDDGYVYELPKGSGLSHLTSRLQRDDLIKSARLAKFYARIFRLDRSIKAGEYHFSAGMSFSQTLQTLIEGSTVKRSMTFVEGWSTRQLLDALNGEANLTAEPEALDFAQLSASLSLGHEHPEGLFYADTYFFSKGTSQLDLLKRSSEKLSAVLQQEWEGREDGLPFANAYEALILASIVEKETGLSSERPLIAGVFVNRLNKKMRLQTDPTVIYGIGKDYNGNITRKHLKTYTAYNTYRIPALPPTPIAIVGRESINAVLHPSKTKNLYFVAKGDGSHYFSPTFEEHKTAVKRYQWKRDKNYRSSPESQD